MNLHAIPFTPRRPSLIVDLSRDPPQPMTAPWTLAEHHAMRGAAVPPAVVRGMWIAAWARAERCPLNVLPAGWLEPHCRYTPSDELWAAVAQGMREIVGALGFAVPILLDQRRRAYAATWPIFWELN
jgi:hypothetical protein